MTTPKIKTRLTRSAALCRQEESRESMFHSPTTGADASVYWGRDHTHVVCAGSEADVADWVTNLHAHKRKVMNMGKVHAGFWESAMALLPRIREWAPIGEELRLSGHSKGAAEAALIAWILSKEGYHVTQVNLFGCPRIGDRRWSGAYDALLRSETLNVQNHRDPVTRVPPGCWGWRHVGQLAYLSRKGDLWTNGHTRNWRVTGDRWWGFVRDIVTPNVELFRYHNMTEYLERVANA